MNPPLQNSFTPAVSTADMASPLPVQHANTVCYVGDFGFLSDHLENLIEIEILPRHNLIKYTTGDKFLLTINFVKL
jgi:protoheme ferro-lyase